MESAEIRHVIPKNRQSKNHINGLKRQVGKNEKKPEEKEGGIAKTADRELIELSTVLTAEISEQWEHWTLLFPVPTVVPRNLPSAEACKVTPSLRPMCLVASKGCILLLLPDVKFFIMVKMPCLIGLDAPLA